jgi:uncharacterized protein YfaA (DUF2138 family)
MKGQVRLFGERGACWWETRALPGPLFIMDLPGSRGLRIAGTYAG